MELGNPCKQEFRNLTTKFLSISECFLLFRGCSHLASVREISIVTAQVIASGLLCLDREGPLIYCPKEKLPAIEVCPSLIRYASLYCIRCSNIMINIHMPGIILNEPLHTNLLRFSNNVSTVFILSLAHFECH